MLLSELNSTRASVGCEKTETFGVLNGDGNEWKERSVGCGGALNEKISRF
jgi:hypothetical protein